MAIHATLPATISEGATGETVKWLQYNLIRDTLSDATQVDGIFGPITKTAVEQFQTENHLTVDGIVGPVTWGALHGGDAEPPTLSQGSQGAVVKALQKALNEGRGDFAPSSNPVLALDGDFGPHTETAVRGTQTMGGIPSDGIVGLQTWALSVHATSRVLADLCGVRAP
jgi:peptidoglycan hydrolase-like protein with peptidoglycan-binding domain